MAYRRRRQIEGPRCSQSRVYPRQASVSILKFRSRACNTLPFHRFVSRRRQEVDFSTVSGAVLTAGKSPVPKWPGNKWPVERQRRNGRRTQGEISHQMDLETRLGGGAQMFSVATRVHVTPALPLSEAPGYLLCSRRRERNKPATKREVPDRRFVASPRLSSPLAAGGLVEQGIRCAYRCIQSYLLDLCHPDAADSISVAIGRFIR
jgi:hypothetical protein